MAGASCVPLFAEKASANAPRITRRSEAKRKTKKGHRAFLKLRYTVLAKLNQSEVDFASNHGTMPPSVEVGFPSVSCRLVWVKRMAGLVVQPASVSSHRAAQQINARELLPFVFTRVTCQQRKGVIGVSLADPQSRDFKRWADLEKMSIPLDRDQLLERLTQSLRAIEINSQLYDAEEIVAWMPITTELYKLLISDRYGALVLELFPDLKLHPPDAHMSASDIRYLLQSPGFKTEDGRIKADLFDLSAPKINIQDWLKRDIIEVKGTRASIEDFVLLMRNNISAHTSKKILGGKAGAIERFGIITQAGITQPAFTSMLIDIATYLVAQLNAAMGREPGSRLLLIDQHRLREIAQQHDEAKDLMDKIVQRDVDLTDENASTARRKLENSANLLLLPELRLRALLIYTHLGEAYWFSYVANKDIRHFFRAISALENAKILFDVASTRQQALILFNLGRIYNAASVSLGRLTCWRISFNYFQELINTVSRAEEPDLYINAVYEATWVALKLLRLPTAYKYFRLYRTRVNT